MKKNNKNISKEKIKKNEQKTKSFEGARIFNQLIKLSSAISLLLIYLSLMENKIFDNNQISYKKNLLDDL